MYVERLLVRVQKLKERAKHAGVQKLHAGDAEMSHRLRSIRVTTTPVS